MVSPALSFMMTPIVIRVNASNGSDEQVLKAVEARLHDGKILYPNIIVGVATSGYIDAFKKIPGVESVTSLLRTPADI